MTADRRGRPLITVTMPVFDNAQHLGAAVRSILAQSLRDFELIVVDDGSVDDSAEIARSFADERVKVIQQANHGGAHATNRAVEAARGRYIALFAGDDVSLPQRLERELGYLERHGGRAVFSWADFIDDQGRPLHGPHFAERYFNHPARSRAEMLRHFFFEGNYLCTVSALIERELLVEAGPFPETSAQLPDFTVWCRLLRRHQLHMLDEPLVQYRVRAGETNVSGPGNADRTYFELVQMHRQELSGLPSELFREAFARDLRNPGFAGQVEQDLELAFLWLSHPVPPLRRLGAERLYALLQDRETLRTAEVRYRFGLADLLRLTVSPEVVSGAEHAVRARLVTAEAEYGRLETYTRAALADKDREIAGLREALATTESEYRKIEAYAREASAAAHDPASATTADPASPAPVTVAEAGGSSPRPAEGAPTKPVGETNDGAAPARGS